MPELIATAAGLFVASFTVMYLVHRVLIAMGEWMRGNNAD